MPTRIEFIFQEYKNIKNRKTNTQNGKNVFKKYIVETLVTKRGSAKDRRKLFNIYKQL